MSATPLDVSAVARAGDLAEKIRALRDPGAYAERCAAIEAIETHFSWIFLTPAHAYKLKKPTGNPAVDLNTIAARRRSCAEELRLNRRLARDVYLDIVPLVRTADDALRVAGEGLVVDWLVRMRRLPAARMLDRAMVRSQIPTRALTAVGVRLAQFYRAQPAIPFTQDRYLQRLAGQIALDEAALRDSRLGIDRGLLETTVAVQRSAMAACTHHLRRRAALGRIVEAHGDLRPEHICLSNPPRIIDALEFSQDLRILDPAEELAYLWIECNQAGGADVGTAVLAGYIGASGDAIGEALLDFYRSRRALVRAKILAWHLLDPEVAAKAPWRERATDYVRRAQQWAARSICTTTATNQLACAQTAAPPIR